MTAKSGSCCYSKKIQFLLQNATTFEAAIKKVNLNRQISTKRCYKFEMRDNSYNQYKQCDKNFEKNL